MPIHLNGNSGEIAPIVLLPGDPDRARKIAEEYLESPRQYTAVRGLLGYTGVWGGYPVSVQASGMGGPSAAIVVEELAMLGARAILRIGTCGSLQPDVSPGSLVIANSASSCDGTSTQLSPVVGYAPAPSWELTSVLVQSAQTTGRACQVGGVASMDLFYDPRPRVARELARMGVLALEMEAAAVFTLCARKRIQAAAIFAVTDIIKGQIRASKDVIDGVVDAMIRIALQSTRLWTERTAGKC